MGVWGGGMGLLDSRGGQHADPGPDYAGNVNLGVLEVNRSRKRETPTLAVC